MKRLTIIALTLMVLLTSCARERPTPAAKKPPSAETLMSEALPTEYSEGVSADVSIDMSADIDMSSFSEGSTMGISLCVDLKLTATKSVARIKGDGEMQVLGMNINMPVDAYYDMKSGVSYNLNSESGEWDIDTEYSGDILSQFSSLCNVDALSDVEMEEYVDGSDYVVKGKLDLAKYSADLPMLDSLAKSEISGVAEALYIFDKDTQNLKTVRIDISDMKLDESSGAVTYTMTFKEFGTGVVVEPPNFGG